MLVIGAGLIWIGSSGAYGTLVAALAVVAVGLGCVEALVSPLVAELHPDDVPTQMNVLHAFYPAGIVVPSLLVGWLLSRGLDWRVPFRVCALPAVLVGPAFLLGRGRQSADRGSGRRLAPMSVRRILAAPAFPLLAVAMLLAAGCEGGLFYWIPNFVQEVHGAGPTAGGVALTAFSVAMMVGRFGAGAATRVVPQRRLLVWLAVGGLGAGVGLVLAGGVVLSVALCAVAGLCVAAFWPGILSLAAARISVGSATLYAMLSVCGIAGFGAMPFAVGVVGQWLGLRAGIAAVPMGFAATAAVLALALRPVQERPDGDRSR